MPVTQRGFPLPLQTLESHTKPESGSAASADGQKDRNAIMVATSPIAAKNAEQVRSNELHIRVSPENGPNHKNRLKPQTAVV